MMFQLCYASTSTSEKSHLPLDLREVSNEARNFNYVNNIHGVLYFADGYFSSVWRVNKELFWNCLIKSSKIPAISRFMFLILNTSYKVISKIGQ